MPTKRRLTFVITLLIIVLAISLVYNAVQFTDRHRLINQRLALENELRNQREMARQQLHHSPASVTDIQTGKDLLAIPQEFHHRRVQIVPYDKKLADSGWLVIDLPSGLSFQLSDLDLTLFYRDPSGEKNHERALPDQNAESCFNGAKQRLEIPVHRHLSSLCRLRLSHENGTSWGFRIEDSKLIWEEN